MRRLVDVDGVTLSGGVLVLVLQTTAAVWCGWRISRRHFAPDWLASIVAATVLSICCAVLVLEVVGSVGLLGPIAPLLITGVVAAAVMRFVPARSMPPLRAPRWPTQLGDAVLGAGIAVTCLVLTAPVVVSLDRWRPNFDALASHLPVAGQFVQRESTWFFPYASPVAFSAHYPANAELLAAWIMAPLSRDVFVQMASLPGLFLLVTATAMLARTLGAARWTAIGAGLLLPAMPRSVVDQVATNMQDLLTTGALIATFAFAARRWKATGPARAELVLGGLAAGLAMGTRYGAGLLIAPALVALVLPSLLPRRGHGRQRVDIATATRHSLLVIGMIVLTGGYWYVRNQAFGGSPLYPESVPWKQVDAYERFNFPFISTYLELGWQPATWRRGIGFIWRYDGVVALALAAGSIGFPALALWRRERSLFGWVWALTPLALLVAFAITPAAPGLVFDGQSEPTSQLLNLRYGIGIVSVSAALFAAAIARCSPTVERLAMGGALLVGAITTVAKAELPISWAKGLAAAAVVLCASLVLALVARAAPRQLRLGGLVALVLLGAAATPRFTERFDDRRLIAMPLEAERLAVADVEGSLAVAGFCTFYGLYGPELDRKVEYLTGDDETIDRPLAASSQEWLASLEAHDVGALVLSSDICYSELDLPYERWVADHPEVFELVGASVGSSVYLVHLPGSDG